MTLAPKCQRAPVHSVRRSSLWMTTGRPHGDRARVAVVRLRGSGGRRRRRGHRRMPRALRPRSTRAHRRRHVAHGRPRAVSVPRVPLSGNSAPLHVRVPRGRPAEAGTPADRRRADCETVCTRRPGRNSTEVRGQRPIAHDEAAQSTRSFRSPSGLTWTARLVYLPPSPLARLDAREPAASGAVLRFHTGGVVLDLVEWPDDWSYLSDDRLTALLRRSQPALHSLPPRNY
jgi:hypothetical protein